MRAAMPRFGRRSKAGSAKSPRRSGCWNQSCYEYIRVDKADSFANLNTPEDWSVSAMAEEFPHYIEFRHVYKTFDKPVLVDSNFYVDAGQTVAIIGRSGVGKSVSLGAHHGIPEAGSGAA